MVRALSGGCTFTVLVPCRLSSSLIRRAMKPALGLTCGLAAVTKSSACFRVHSCMQCTNSRHLHSLNIKAALGLPPSIFFSTSSTADTASISQVCQLTANRWVFRAGIGKNFQELHDKSSCSHACGPQEDPDKKHSIAMPQLVTVVAFVVAHHNPHGAGNATAWHRGSQKVHAITAQHQCITLQAPILVHHCLHEAR